MRVPPHATNFDGLIVSLTENKHKTAIHVSLQDGNNPRDLEEWLEFQPQRFFILGLDPDTYNVVIWVTSQVGGRAVSSWLNAKTTSQVPRTFTKLVEALKTTTLLPSIRDNAIISMMALNRVNKTFPHYTMMSNDFERRSKADMNDGVRATVLLMAWRLLFS
jgi:hypothetical protein